MKFASAVVLSAALCAGGCISLTPPYMRPALPVPDSWDAASPPASSAAESSRDAPANATSAPIQLDWRSYFPDVQLQALIEQALGANRDLRIAVQRVEQARATYGVRRADTLPTIAASAAYVRLHTPGVLAPGGSLDAAAYQVGLSESNWELDFWGRVRNLKDAALEQYLASDAARRAATLGVIANVADNYLLLRELDERISVARETIASRSDSLRIFRRRFEVGAISKLDLRQSEILLQQAQVLVAQLEQSRATQAHALAVLVGAPARLQPAPLADTSVYANLQPGLPSSLLERRPDIVAAEHQLRAANANIGAARAAFFPRVTLTSAVGSTSTELHNLFASGSGAWIFMPNLSLPIFDANRNRSNLELAKAREGEAVAQYEKTIQEAFRDVANALSAREWLAAQVQTETDTLAAQTERARLARLRYDNGATPFLEVLDAQRDLLNARQQLIQTRRALLSSRVALYAALGGDVQDREQTGAPPVPDIAHEQGPLP
ncbi:efflux transporter outer membrane subunit [Paraburkholderia phenoliruptrix]|nr:efflux transporter outer membrane subunit [Paraburkholderia phenoliruptrix]MBW0451190.1 efflux transporter outer membrane subunit [Paraburkholderia phenoliruptrix]MBW9100373.1 efflux transporter outer membrane subunit [Paraburkholderia phenoliruptrix]